MQARSGMRSEGDREMCKPLGQDKLGRLIYEDDIVVDGDLDRWLVLGESDYGGIDLKRGPWSWLTLPEAVCVELDDSPKRSNYARYFADLGTIEEVIDASNTRIEQDCRGQSCNECPFNWWGEVFDCITLYCFEFPEWLMKEAVL